MPFQNPYIEKTQSHPAVLQDQKELSELRGKWSARLGAGKPIFLEVGVGMGRFFRLEAASHPENAYVGMELRYKRLWNTAHKLEADRPDGWALVKGRGEDVARVFGPGELSGAFVFFPDPWPKKKQKKHRMVQKPFLTDLAKCVRKGGTLWFKTDHQEYFSFVVDEVLPQCPEWELKFVTRDLHADPAWSGKFVKTEFEVMTMTKEGAKVGLAEIVRK